MKSSSSGKILGFDGIRGLAVLSVVFTHLRVTDALIARKILPAGMMDMFHGSTGVQIFFVLSGFLITMLLIAEFDEFRQVSLKKFYIRRALRILPIYFIFLILVTVLHNYSRTSAQSLLFAYTYIYNFIPIRWYSSILGHTWSLAVEEHFYLIWPFFFMIFFHARRKTLLFAMCLLFLLSNLLWNILGSVQTVTENFYLERWTFIAGSNILMGCILAILLTGSQRNHFWVNIFQKKSVLFLGALLYANSWIFPLLPFHLEEYLRCLGIGIALAWVYLNQQSRPVKLLEFTPLKFLGTISYGLYIYQGFFLATGPGRDAGQQWPPHPLRGLIFLIIIAPISYWFIEKPFLRYKTQFVRVQKKDTTEDQNPSEGNP